MSVIDQLEIITADGVIEFYDLHPAKGITNVGSHPENDIVLTGSGVAPFHLMVDHRHYPYQLLLLSAESPTHMGGQPLAPEHPVTLHNWDAVEFGGHTLMVLLDRDGANPAGGDGPVREGDAGSDRGAPNAEFPTSAGLPGQPTVRSSFQQATPPPGRPFADPQVGTGYPWQAQNVPDVSGVAAPLAVRPQQGNGAPLDLPERMVRSVEGSQPYNRLLAPVSDQIDESILVELAVREQSVDVEQTVAYHLTITNGGDLVAGFDVQVEGVDPEWVVVLPAQINLPDAGSGIVTITITPPRAHTSMAGRHNLAITVTSPDYPDRYSQVGATLVVNPYYDLQIGDLSRKKQTLTWNDPVGETQFVVANGGNSAMQVQVEAQDEERACNFEFQLLEAGVTFARQAELRLAAGQAAELNLFIEPNERRLIGFRHRVYQYDVRILPMGGQQFPRTVGGQVKVVPLIGRGVILLFAMLLLSLVYVFLSPQATIQVTPEVVDFGTPVYLSWEASRFSSVHLSGPGLINVTPAPRGTLELVPQASGAYGVEASNLISRIGIPSIYDRIGEVNVQVNPVAPTVELNVSQNNVTLGEPVQVAWRVAQANQATLFFNGNPEALPTEQFSGSRVLTPDADLLVELAASNPSVSNSGTPYALRQPIQVFTPTPTPLPEPSILVFDVSPVVVTAGDPVNLQWRVLNAPLVSIDGIGDGLPNEGNRQIYPMQNATYVLRAVTEGGQAVQEVSVFVQPLPTATATPQAPVIEFFEINPKTIVLGDDEPVKLSWSIKGDLSAVEIFSPDLQLTTSLTRSGTIPIFPEKSTFFILTAINREQSSTAQVEIAVNEPTPTPTGTLPPTPTETPLPTATPIPRPGIVFFGADSGDSPPSPDKVQLIRSGTYHVLVGSLVRLSWSTTMATRLQLTAIQADNSTLDYGNRPLSGEFVFRYDGTIRQFQLQAYNEPGDLPSGSPLPEPAGQIITLEPREIQPTAPFGLAGTVEEGQNKLSWSYDAQYLELIRTFKVYRADAADLNFLPAAEVDRTVTTWIDSIQPNCGRAYFVVGTYIDVDGNQLETDPTATSWFSPTCS